MTAMQTRQKCILNRYNQCFIEIVTKCEYMSIILTHVVLHMHIVVGDKIWCASSVQLI